MIPPEEFELKDVYDPVCDNCNSSNITEKPEPPGLPWPKIMGAVGLLILLLGIIWYWLSSDPLTLKAESNCAERLVTLIAKGGDGSPIIYSVEGLKSTSNSNVFEIPEGQQNGSKLMFYATQGGETINTEYTLNCPKKNEPEIPRGNEGEEPNPGNGGRTPSIVWTKVPGSEFCVSNCVQSYSETDNLGHTRERKIENCTDCQMDEK